MSRKSILVEIAIGELVDKITILEIKTQRISNPEQNTNARIELDLLTSVRDQKIPLNSELDRLTDELRQVNETLWEIEDATRDCERRQDFGPRFIKLARSVYRHNDHRARLKRQINEETGSKIVEEKHYAEYE